MIRCETGLQVDEGARDVMWSTDHTKQNVIDVMLVYKPHRAECDRCEASLQTTLSSV